MEGYLFNYSLGYKVGTQWYTWKLYENKTDVTADLKKIREQVPSAKKARLQKRFCGLLWKTEKTYRQF